MASTRLLLEGPDIDDLLTRVREEHGPGVRIVHADKVRSGGIGGFFAREKFAVTIELDPAPAPLPQQEDTESAGRSVAEPGTLLELAEVIDAAEVAEANIAMSTKGMATSKPPVAPAGEALMLPPGHAPISTQRPDFAAVLAGLAKTTQSSPSPASATSVTSADQFVAAAIARVDAPPAAIVPTGATPESIGDPAEDTDPYLAAGRRRGGAIAAPKPLAPATGNPLVRRLLELGLPDEMATELAGVGLATLRESLVRVLAERPLPPVTDLQGGDVLVIAGPGAVAHEVACDVARRLRLDPADVLLAAPSGLGVRLEPEARISGPVDARRRSGRLRRSNVPTVVAVDAPCDGESAEWARTIADSLGARVMWAVVDATSKPGDLIDHLSALGRLDGLVVRGVSATRDPATVLRAALELTLPTVLVDGRPGDAEAWAALLIERIGDLA